MKDSRCLRRTGRKTLCATDLVSNAPAQLSHRYNQKYSIHDVAVQELTTGLAKIGAHNGVVS